MLIVISPAKTLDFETTPVTRRSTQPELLDCSETLVDELSTKSPADLGKLMKISSALSELNVERYHNWSRPFTLSNAKQAVLTFKGDVYSGLEAEKFTTAQMNYAQQYLRILSGLYGILRPLDLMQPYRLEMGTKLATQNAPDLYKFWDSTITDEINKQLQAIDSNILINLASNEYFKVLQAKSINAKVVTPRFKDWSNGQYRTLGFFAKKARGQMAGWIIKNKVKTLAKLRRYDLDGYNFSEADSDPLNPVFLRKQG